jgi:hypothetical protein
MVKFSTAAVAVPLFVTAALDPAAPVVTDPICTVAAAPVGPAPPAAASTAQFAASDPGTTPLFGATAR